MVQLNGKCNRVENGKIKELNFMHMLLDVYKFSGEKLVVPPLPQTLNAVIACGISIAHKSAHSFLHYHVDDDEFQPRYRLATSLQCGMLSNDPKWCATCSE